MRNGKSLAIGFVVLALTAGLLMEHRARIELQKQLAVFDEQIKQISASKPVALPQAVQPEKPNDAVEKLRGDLEELQERLLRQEMAMGGVSNFIATATGANVRFVYPDSIKKKDYVNAGFDQPQSAWQSMLWAIAQSDPKAYLESLSGDLAVTFKEQIKDLPEGIMPSGFKNGLMFQSAGYRVMEEKAVSDTEVELKVFLEGRQNLVLKPYFRRTADGWKYAGQR